MTSAPSRFRDPGSLQRASSPAAIEFLEVIIAGDRVVELRTDSGWSRIAHVAATPRGPSQALWEAGDSGHA